MSEVIQIDTRSEETKRADAAAEAVPDSTPGAPEPELEQHVPPTTG